MSFIINLMKDGEEVPLEIYPEDDFNSIVERANLLVGYKIDISSFTGEDVVDPSDNVYDYFMNNEPSLKDHFEYGSNNALEYLEEDAEAIKKLGNNSTIIIAGDDSDERNVIKIIELSDNEDNDGQVRIKMEPPFIKSELLELLPMLENVSNMNDSADGADQLEGFLLREKINVNRIIETIVKNRVTCHFCNIRVSNMKDPRRNYIFDEKNQSIFNQNVLMNIVMSAKLICGKCLNNNFQKLSKSSKKLNTDESIVVSDKMKVIYRSLPDEETFKSRRKSRIIVKQDVDSLLDDEDYVVTKEKKKRGRKKAAHASAPSNFVVRRKITSNVTDAELQKKTSVIKRKLEMDGTISEFCVSNEEDMHSQSKRMKMPGESELICRSCGLQFEDLTAVVEHGPAHHVNNRINGIPCGLCLRSFKSISVLKRHVYSDHIQSQPIKAEKRDEIKLENTKYHKKEEYHDEHEAEDDLTDRLHKYLSGEIDADTFFQQEHSKTVQDSQVVPDEDDDDLEVWIVQAEKPGEENDKEKIVDISSLDDDEQDDGDELAFLNAIDNSTNNAENVSQINEAFEDVDYYEDPEYEPEENDDNDSCKSVEISRPRRRIGQGKYKCDTCKKGYTSQLRLEQHKCCPGNISDKKDDLTCFICNEIFLSKVRLQFHKQTHREGGWQEMGCDQCGRRDFNSEHELFDHIYFSHSKPFICPYEGCTKTFKLKKLLKTHMKDHGIKKYACNICNQRFQVHQTLKEHMVLHMRVKPFQCHICQKYMSKASRLRMHLLVHTSQQNPAHVLVCKICDGAFKDVEEAESHTEKPEMCEPKVEDTDGIYDEEMYEDMGIEILSPNTFYNDQDIKPAWRKEDSLKKEGTDATEAGSGPTLSNKHSLLMQLSDSARKTITAVWIDKVYSCQYCEKVYYTKEALHQHRHMHSNSREPYQCHLCEARFLTYARCTAHKSTHGYFKEGGAPSLRDFPVIKHYLCDLCDKSNLLWTTVSVHYRHHHRYNVNRRDPPPCKNCCQQFYNSWDLGKHRRLKHRREVHAAAKAPIKVVNYSYKCLECDQQLPNKAALTSHRKAAHGDGEGGKKPKNAGVLVCSECGKTYATKPALLTHIKWHTEHGVGIEAARRRKRAFGKGSHICSTCGLGFYSAANLRAHIDRIHEKCYKYTCEECGKGHFTHVEMETHKLTHTGERPFKCPDCPRAYVTKAILNKHYRNHTGERPYSCDLCGAAFKTAHSRNYHKLKHENGKLPAPLIILEVKGGDAKGLEAALQEMQGMGESKKESKIIKHYIEEGGNIKEEIEEEFQQEVNEEEVLIRTSEVDESDENVITEETPDGVHIFYRGIVRGMDEQGCENEYTIEYEEAQ